MQPLAPLPHVASPLQGPPRAEFNPVSGQLTFQPMDGALVVYSADGSEPTRHSEQYRGPVAFQKPYPRSVRAMAIARCKYVSDVAFVELPGEAVPKQAMLVMCPRRTPPHHRCPGRPTLTFRTNSS